MFVHLFVKYLIKILMEKLVDISMILLRRLLDGLLQFYYKTKSMYINVGNFSLASPLVSRYLFVFRNLFRLI